jgi:phage replication O-like protein O
MSSPQVENGFTRIANELLDQILLAPLRGQQMKIIFFLIRKTYGYGKKSDKLSLQQWADGIGIERHNVWRELQGLIDGNMIHVQDNGPKRPKTYSVNKDYETWFAQSVVASDDKSVVADDYSSTQSVVADDYKSVVTPHESTKERKKAEAATTAKPKPTSLSICLGNDGVLCLHRGGDTGLGEAHHTRGVAVRIKGMCRHAQCGQLEISSQDFGTHRARWLPTTAASSTRHGYR